MKIYYPIYPIAFYDQLTLVYDYSYRKPIRHYRFDSELTHILRSIIKGEDIIISNKYLEIIDRLDFIDRLDIPINERGMNYIIIDFSIGGPSLWGKNLYKYLNSKNKKTVFYSFSRQELFINAKKINVSNIFSKKIIFSTIARFLCQYFFYDKCIIIGREIGIRMFDILDNNRTVIIETGFGEKSIVPIKKGSEVFNKKVIDELLFRENTYPWDSVADAYASAKVIEKYKNIVWSEFIVKDLKSRFVDSDIQFQPPSIFFDLNKLPKRSKTKKLSVLVGLGNHQIGERSFDFLNLKPLLNILKDYKNYIKITILTKQGEKLKHFISNPEIDIIDFSSQEHFFKLLNEHDIYYRVQNDQSIPISIIEAMSKGCVSIINKKCSNTWSKLVNFKNIVLVNFGDEKDLRIHLMRLIENRQLVNEISKRATKIVKEYCDIEIFLFKQEIK